MTLSTVLSSVYKDIVDSTLEAVGKYECPLVGRIILYHGNEVIVKPQ